MEDGEETKMASNPPSMNEETRNILEKLPHLKFSKYMSGNALNETSKMLEKLPAFEYPITSTADFIEKLGGPDKGIAIGEKEYLAIRAREIPAYYFPIVSADNLVEKLIEIINRRRQTFPSKSS